MFRAIDRVWGSRIWVSVRVRVRVRLRVRATVRVRIRVKGLGWEPNPNPNPNQVRAELAKVLGALREELFRNHNSQIPPPKTKLRSKAHLWSDKATTEMAEKLPVSHSHLAWR